MGMDPAPACDDDAGTCPMMQRCDPATHRCVRPDCADAQAPPTDAALAPAPPDGEAGAR
jgi:hypothetical protein